LKLYLVTILWSEEKKKPMIRISGHAFTCTNLSVASTNKSRYIPCLHIPHFFSGKLIIPILSDLLALAQSHLSFTYLQVRLHAINSQIFRRKTTKLLVFDIAKVKLPKEYGIISYGFVAKVAYTSLSIGT
jgi:hypothetical protein